LYQLTEELTDLEDAFCLWRLRRVITMERNWLQARREWHGRIELVAPAATNLVAITDALCSQYGDRQPEGCQLDWTKGNIAMAGVFGKDPNMKRKGSQQELDRIMGERARNKAAAAAKFRQKKPAATAPQQAEPPKT
jgi:hypothetical protein